MKNGLMVLLIVFNLQVNCKSQISNIRDTIIETKQKFVIGYSKQFPSLVLGISFQKSIAINDTVFYVKLVLTTSTSENKSDLSIGKNNNITFLSKSGKSVALTVNANIPMDEIDIHKDDSYAISTTYYYTATLYLKVNKEQLLTIGSEPFYNLTLTYNDAQAKKVKIAVFSSPNFYTRRSFIQKDIKDLLSL
jgi:hypothetical protein